MRGSLLSLPARTGTNAFSSPKFTALRFFAFSPSFHREALCARKPWMSLETTLYLLHSGGDLITRHNRVRNVVHKLCQEARLSPVLEKEILGHHDLTKRRLRDVYPLWTGGRGLAVDVAVI